MWNYKITVSVLHSFSLQTVFKASFQQTFLLAQIAVYVPCFPVRFCLKHSCDGHLAGSLAINLKLLSASLQTVSVSR